MTARTGTEICNARRSRQLRKPAENGGNFSIGFRRPLLFVLRHSCVCFGDKARRGEDEAPVCLEVVKGLFPYMAINIAIGLILVLSPDLCMISYNLFH